MVVVNTKNSKDLKKPKILIHSPERKPNRGRKLKTKDLQTTKQVVGFLNEVIKTSPESPRVYNPHKRVLLSPQNPKIITTGSKSPSPSLTITQRKQFFTHNSPRLNISTITKLKKKLKPRLLKNFRSKSPRQVPLHPFKASRNPSKGVKLGQNLNIDVTKSSMSSKFVQIYQSS